jgi:hypothetical protein
MARISSPGAKPDAAAAELGETFATLGRSALKPTPKKIAKIRINPMTKCAKEPAPRTINLRREDAVKKARTS